MGELHLEVIRNRLLRDFRLNVKVHKPRVSYRETIQQTIDPTGSCHRQMGGQNLFAEIRLRMEPNLHGTQPVAITSRCPTEQLPGELLATLLDELRSRGEGGGIVGGFPLMNLKVTVLGATCNEHTNDIAVRIAGGDAFEKGLREGDPILLEPVMRLSITTPEDYLGDFVGDLQQRRALIQRTENRGKLVVIEAHAPLAGLFGYSSAMRSISQGRASCSMEPFEYAPAPEEVARSFEA